MSTKPSIAFVCSFHSDGSDATFTINVKTGPIYFSTANGSIAPSFAIADAIPSEVTDVSVPAGTISSWSFAALTGVLTITLTAALGVGVYTVNGNMNF